MSAIILTRRDIEFFKYLHSCKVATTKQINRDIFRCGHLTCYFRLKKFREKNFIEVTPSKWEVDKSFIFSLTSRGMKVVNSNCKGVINGKRYRSDSISHDLKLVNLRNIFLQFNMVKEYMTENQLQTYDLSSFEYDLKNLKDMRCDALAFVQDAGKPKLLIPLELEISCKSYTEYLKKIREIYYHRDIKFLFYICDSKEAERKIKKIEREFTKDRPKKIFYASYEDILAHAGEIKFINQDAQVFKLN